jgi:hypothetical protein
MINTKRKAFKHTSKYKLKGLRVDPSTKSTARKTTQFVTVANDRSQRCCNTICNRQLFVSKTLGAPSG